MKTVISKRIDDHQVIIGFDRPVVDPVATKKFANDILEKDGDLKAIFNISEAIRTEESEYNNLFYSRGYINWAKLAIIRDTIERLRQEYRIKLNKVEIKRKNLEKENPVFFEPKFGEYIVSDSVYKKINNVSTGDCQLKCLKKIEDGFDAYIVSNFRGKKFYEKTSEGWKEHVVKKLDDDIPLKAKEFKDLSIDERKEYQEQKDLERIKSMSLVKREQERDRKIEQQLRLSAVKKMEYEIQGDPDALEKSQEYFEKKKRELIERYK
jgi:hypothetical protein